MEIKIKLYQLVLAIIAILAVVVAIITYTNNERNVNAQKEEVKETELVIEENKEEEEKEENKDEVNTNTNQTTTNNNKNNTQTKKSPNTFASTIANITSRVGATWKEGDSLPVYSVGEELKGFNNFKAYVSNGKVYVNVSNDIHEDRDLHHNTGFALELDKDVEITGFNKKVKGVYQYQSGHAWGAHYNTPILFLMEDGTVEYLTVVNLVSSKAPKTQGAIKGFNNIVGIYSGTVEEYFGGLATIAKDSDGNYYDLGKVLESVGIISKSE